MWAQIWLWTMNKPLTGDAIAAEVTNIDANEGGFLFPAAVIKALERGEEVHVGLPLPLLWSSKGKFCLSDSTPALEGWSVNPTTTLSPKP
jgi:hypothetical protein